MHAHAAPGQRDGNAAGTDAQFEHRAATRALEEKVDDGVEHRRFEPSDVVVVAGSDVLAEVVRRHGLDSRRFARLGALEHQLAVARIDAHRVAVAEFAFQ